MPRTRAPGRLADVADAALRVFARNGFRDAQMVDVAREAGIALGTLYGYVASKEALFALVVDRTFAEIDADADLPLPTPDRDELLARVAKRMDVAAGLPVLSSAAKRRSTRDARAELMAVLDELWDVTVRTRLAADMLERSARDWPELSRVFYEGVRREILRMLARYVERRAASGAFRRVDDPAIAARLVVETVTWFARHRLGDPDSADVDDARARRTVLAMLAASLLSEGS